MVIPLGFLSHLLWIIFILAITKAQITDNNVALPTTFRSVLYLDVFGWYDQPKKEEEGDADGEAAEGDTAAPSGENPNGSNLNVNRSSGVASVDGGSPGGIDASSTTTGQWVGDDFIEDPGQAQLIRDCMKMRDEASEILVRYQKGREQLDQGSQGQLEHLEVVYAQVRGGIW